MFRGVRGAVTVPENRAEAIQEAVHALVGEVVTRNRIEAAQIVSVFFTMTSDLTTYNPAKAAREGRKDWQHVPILCAQEPDVEGLMPRCIRVLIQWHAVSDALPPEPVYLGATQSLRPDLTSS